MISQESCQYIIGYRATHQAGTQVRRHLHGHWQIDMCFAGGVAIDVGETLPLEAAGIALLPPNVAHSLQYPVDTSFAVVKFEFDPAFRGSGVTTCECVNGVEAGLFSALAALLPASCNEPEIAERRLLEHVVRAFMHAAYPADDRDTLGKPDLAQRVRDYVARRGGRYVTLGDLARELGYSTSHLSSEFKRCEGKALKTFLDQERADVAMRLIRFSDFSLPEIAERLEFPQIHSFSRFIKRMTGKSPREHRSD